MVQKELADRLSSPKGSKQYGAMSLFANIILKLKKVFHQETVFAKAKCGFICNKANGKKLSKSDEDLFFTMTRSFLGASKNNVDLFKRWPLFKRY